jgi:hypothetical protein
MDSHIGLPKFDEPFGSRFLFLKNFGESTLVDMRAILLVEDDKMDEYIHPYTELETLRAQMVCMGMDNMVILSPLPNKDTQTKVRINRTWLDSIIFHHLENSMTLFPLPEPSQVVIYSIALLYETWYGLVFRILFPKGAIDHANIDFSKKAKGYWIKGESLSTNPLSPWVWRKGCIFS